MHQHSPRLGILNVIQPKRAAAEFGGGLVITALTLVDAFSTLVVLGRNRRGLQASTRLLRIGLPIARFFSRRRGGRGVRPSNSFAPAIFVGIAGSWLLLLFVGFGLMFHAITDNFKPPLPTCCRRCILRGPHSRRWAISEVDAQGSARWLILRGGGRVQHDHRGGHFHSSVAGSAQPARAARADAGDPVGIAAIGPDYPAVLRNFEQTFAACFIFRWVVRLGGRCSAKPILLSGTRILPFDGWRRRLADSLGCRHGPDGPHGRGSGGAATVMHRIGSRTAAQLCRVFDL